MSDYIGARCVVDTADGQSVRGTILGDMERFPVGLCFLIRFDAPVFCCQGCGERHEQVMLPQAAVHILEN